MHMIIQKHLNKYLIAFSVWFLTLDILKNIKEMPQKIINKLINLI